MDYMYFIRQGKHLKVGIIQGNKKQEILFEILRY